MYFCLHTNSFCVNFKYMYDKNKKRYYMQFTQSRILSFLLKTIYFANFKLKNYSSIWYFNAFWFFNTIFNKYNMYLIITLTTVVKLAICIYMVKNTNKSIYNILSYIIKFCFYQCYNVREVYITYKYILQRYCCSYKIKIGVNNVQQIHTH